jgi:hypothetical protein
VGATAVGVAAAAVPVELATELPAELPAGIEAGLEACGTTPPAQAATSETRNPHRRNVPDARKRLDVDRLAIALVVPQPRPSCAPATSKKLPPGKYARKVGKPDAAARRVGFSRSWVSSTDEERA